MHICVIAEGYPTKEDPFLPFVRALLVEMVKKGVHCSVIAPQSITRAVVHKKPVRPKFWEDFISKDGIIRVYQPYYYTFSNSSSGLGMNLFAKAVKRTFEKIKNDVDVLYAHFWHMGVIAAQLYSGLPVFVACGESKISVFERFNQDKIELLEKQLSGVIFVGTKSYNEAIDLGLQRNNDYIIAPNGYNKEEFHLMNKQECRRALGYPETEKIVAFVGAFSKRKGIDRLIRALKNTKTKPSAILIGAGTSSEEYSKTLFKGLVPHEKIAEQLNSADLFVLPTNNEGCCNAIVEALACGLPVISSNQVFNDDILDDTCSLRVNPMCEKEITEAIDNILQDPSKLDELREGAICKSEKMNIEQRANNIIGFIQDHSKKID